MEVESVSRKRYAELLILSNELTMENFVVTQFVVEYFTEFFYNEMKQVEYIKQKSNNKNEKRK